MKYIYMTETELVVAEQSPEDSALLGPYSKERLLEYIKEFPDLSHPLPVYRFLYWTGEIYEVVDLASWAREQGLGLPNLYHIHAHAYKSYKGLIKAPESLGDKDYNSRIYKELTVKNNKRFSKFSVRDDFVLNTF